MILNRQKIAFVDYDMEDQAKQAMMNAKGFRFANSQKGITVRYSENTKNNTPQAFGGQPVKKREINSFPQQRREPELPPRGMMMNPMNQMNQMNPPPFPGKQAPVDISQLLSLAQNIAHLNSTQSSPSLDVSSQFVSNASLLTSLLGPALGQQGAKPPSEALARVSGLFGPNIMPIPKNATNTVYIEGIPLDASEREVAHIFRPFPGFKSIRLISREKKPGEKVIFCFADFENAFQSTLVINTLQGYRFDKDDILGLQFSYAVSNNKFSGPTLNF